MDLKKMMQQAQALQQKMTEAQARLADLVVDGSAGGGMVTLSLDGKGGLVALRIDPSLMTPGEETVVEDLVRAAHADAKRKLDAAQAEATQSMMAGMPNLPFNIPGF